MRLRLLKKFQNPERGVEGERMWKEDGGRGRMERDEEGENGKVEGGEEEGEWRV